MSWTGLDAKTVDEALVELATMRSGALHVTGYLNRLNVWSLHDGQQEKPGTLRLDLLAELPEGLLYRTCGLMPDAYDVPVELLVSEALYPWQELDDRVYATWLAKVLYLRFLAGETTLTTFERFHTSFRDFHKACTKLHWW